MIPQYIEHRFIQKDKIEYRDYQVNLSNQAKTQNCLVILPTGLGKNIIGSLYRITLLFFDEDFLYSFGFN